MDTIVIGAGLAGLAAAERLGRAEKHVLMLEARARVGGRVWTQWAEGLDYPIDLGAEWIGDGEVRDLLKKHDVALREAGGRQLRRHEGQWQDMSALGLVTGQLRERIRELGGKDRPVDQAIAECCGDPVFDEARELLLGYIRSFHAADPSRMSTRWFLTVEENQPADASQYRSEEGTGKSVDLLLERIAGPCEVLIKTVVREIRWKPGGVTVIADVNGREEHFEAPKAIVTLPLPQLRDGVRFTPMLSDRADALGTIAMGDACKIVLRFRECFWETDPVLRGVLFFHDFDQPVHTWWTAAPTKAPILTGWTAGPGSARYRQASDEQVVDEALDSLAAALAIPRRVVDEQLVSRHFHNWSKDPFAQGAYSYVTSGGADAHQFLARSLEDTLFFAGEATCGGGLNATMEGAMQSGRRAADESLS